MEGDGAGAWKQAQVCELPYTHGLLDVGDPSPRDVEHWRTDLCGDMAHPDPLDSGNYSSPTSS